MQITFGIRININSKNFIIILRMIVKKL